MKFLRFIILGLTSVSPFLFTNSSFAQQVTGNEITLTAGAPTGVTTANARIVGNTGFGTAYYWFVAVWPIGQARIYGPLQVTNVPNTLSVSNYVQLNWNLVAGASSYTVLKTTSPLLPTGASNIALVTGNTSGTVNDTGGALSSFTPNQVTGASGNIFINNSTFTDARFQFSIPLQVTKICFSDGTCQTTAGGGGGSYNTIAVGGTDITPSRTTVNFVPGLGITLAGADVSSETQVTVATDPITVGIIYNAGNPLPVSPTTGQVAFISDASSSSSCVTGSGSTFATCIYNGSSWVAQSSSTPILKQWFPTCARASSGSNLQYLYWGNSTLDVDCDNTGSNDFGNWGVSLGTGALRNFRWPFMTTSALTTTINVQPLAALRGSSGTGTYVIQARCGCRTNTQLSNTMTANFGSWATATVTSSTVGAATMSTLNVTPGGTCSAGAYVMCEIGRDTVTNTGDTASQNLIVLGATITLQ